MPVTSPAAQQPAGDFTRREWAALLFVVCCGFSSQMVSPLWVSAIISDFGLTAAAAGRVSSFEFMAVAAVSVVVAVNIRRFPTRKTVILGMALLLAGNAASAFTPNEHSLTVARMICGVGKGLVEAVVFSLVAGSVNPTRGFATLNIAYAVFSTVFYLTVPYAIEREGAAGAFHTMAVVALAGAAFLPFFPRQPLVRSEVAGFSLRRIPRYGVVAFVALIVLWSGQNAIMTFIDRIGSHLGMTGTGVGRILSLSALLTIAGPVLARAVDTRFGFTVPLLTAIVIQIAVTLLLGHSLSAAAFSLTVPIFMLLPLVMTPYLMGILSLADPAGRLSAASSAAMTAGASLGAWAGGIALTGAGYPALSWTAAGQFAVCLVLFVFIAPIATRHGVHARAAAAGAFGDPA